MTGTLYLCATPIGNLEDMTFRVVRTLKEVDLIAAEDTRNSIKLLNHFEIKTPMTSYHEFNKIDKAYQLVNKLREGKNIALITDAGTPGISDPGEDLVRICYEEGIEAPSDTVIDELKQLALEIGGETDGIAMALAVYMLGFRTYTGFNEIYKVETAQTDALKERLHSYKRKINGD